MLTTQKISTSDQSDIQTKLIDAMVETIKNINAKPKDAHGIWYPDEYEQYCKENGIEYKKEYITGYTNPEFWEQIGERETFMMKKGKKASNALQAFLNGLTLGDCGNMMVACQYAALLEVFGEEKFNLIFDPESNPIVISQMMTGNPVQSSGYFFEFTPGAEEALIGTVGNRPIKKGDMCHIAGVSFYTLRHPTGTSAGENVICVGKNEKGEDLFYGFDGAFKDKPLTEREIRSLLLENYNLPRNHFDEELISKKPNPKYKSILELGTLPTTNPLDLTKGFLVASSIGPVLPRIEKYAQMDSKEAAENFMKDYNYFIRNRMLKSWERIPLTSLKSSYERMPEKSFLPDDLTISFSDDDHSLFKLDQTFGHDEKRFSKTKIFPTPKFSEMTEQGYVNRFLNNPINESIKQQLREKNVSRELTYIIINGGIDRFIHYHFVNMDQLICFHEKSPWILDALRRSNFTDAIYSKIITIDQIGKLTEIQVKSLLSAEEGVKLKNKIDDYIKFNDQQSIKLLKFNTEDSVSGIPKSIFSKSEQEYKKILEQAKKVENDQAQALWDKDYSLTRRKYPG